MSIKEFFETPSKYRMWSLALIGVGVLSIIIEFILYGTGEHPARFWATLMQNSIYFLLVTNAAMFFMCATTLAWGGFRMSDPAWYRCIDSIDLRCNGRSAYLSLAASKRRSYPRREIRILKLRVLY